MIHGDPIGKMVQCWVPEYNPEMIKNPRSPWEQVAMFHGKVGCVVECDEDDPTWGMAAFRVIFEDGQQHWFWRRELRPVLI